MTSGSGLYTVLIAIVISLVLRYFEAVLTLL